MIILEQHSTIYLFCMLVVIRTHEASVLSSIRMRMNSKLNEIRGDVLVEAKVNENKI